MRLLIPSHALPPSTVPLLTTLVRACNRKASELRRKQDAA